MNSIPVIGWLISFILTASSAVPFWLCWTYFGIGKTYFYWLPPVYQAIPFWDCVGLFTAVGIALRVFTPKLAYVSNRAEATPAGDEFDDDECDDDECQACAKCKNCNRNI